MHTNLMSASGAWNRLNDAEPITGRRRFSEPAFHKQLRLCWCTRGVDHLLEPDDRGLVLTLAIQRSVNELVFPCWPAPNDREIFFAQRALLHQEPKLACGCGSFRNQHQAARFAIPSVF